MPFSSSPSVRQESTESDAELLVRICAGDRVGFRLLVERHSQKLYRVAYRFINNRTEAEDILQDAFVKLWERPNMWNPDYSSSFTTWFCRVIINLCLDQRKRKSPLNMADHPEMEQFADHEDTHENTMIKQERERMLETYIAALPERQRTALNLCFYEGFSNQEAADIMRINIKAVQSLIMRAKDNLKTQLQNT